MTTYIVTGGAGYIGSEVVARLMGERKAGDTVMVIDNLRYGGDALRRHYDKDGFLMLKHDLGYGWPDALLRDNRNSDTVLLHLAGIVGEAACKEDQDAAARINLGLFSHPLPKVPRYIFVSSCSVYGPGENMDYDAHPQPCGDYATSKRYGELHALAHGGYVIRPATVVGLSMRQRFDTPLNNVALCAALDEKFSLYGPTHFHPYVVIDELVDYLVRAMNPVSSPPRISNVCTANVTKQEIHDVFPDATEIVTDTPRGFSYSIVPHPLPNNRSNDVFVAAQSVRDAIRDGFVYDPKSHRHTNVGWSR